MSERFRGLPEFPSEESNRYERAMGPRNDPPDRIVDRLRHAWPVYTIFGGLLSLWLLALLATGLSSHGWEAFWVVLSLPLLLLAIAVRVWWWSLIFWVWLLLDELPMPRRIEAARLFG